MYDAQNPADPRTVLAQYPSYHAPGGPWGSFGSFRRCTQDPSPSACPAMPGRVPGPKRDRFRPVAGGNCTRIGDHETATPDPCANCGRTGAWPMRWRSRTTRRAGGTGSRWQCRPSTHPGDGSQAALLRRRGQQGPARVRTALGALPAVPAVPGGSLLRDRLPGVCVSGHGSGHRGAGGSGTRGCVESRFEAAKGTVGLDAHEVRRATAGTTHDPGLLGPGPAPKSPYPACKPGVWRPPAPGHDPAPVGGPRLSLPPPGRGDFPASYVCSRTPPSRYADPGLHAPIGMLQHVTMQEPIPRVVRHQGDFGGLVPCQQ